MQELGTSVHQCPECMRFHTLPAQAGGEKGACTICGSDERDRSLLAVVASDSDLAALERSRTYRGRYFVLGGLLSLASDSMSGLRVRELLASLPHRLKQGLTEIILAFPANPEGDSTSIRVREELSALAKEKNFKLSTLGRGLSTGSELEYADPDTLKSALENRR